jgi:A/G-specific adenine glycosylase
VSLPPAAAPAVAPSAAPDVAPDAVRSPGAMVAALHAWGDAVRRDLPWRRTRDPWAVLVSEAMLQQTQVVRVVERFGPFLDRFPTPGAMADAPLGEVLEAWAGLGYYRRARDLHRTAIAVTAQHEGRVPGTLEALLALPGVGPYTARAVLAFAFEHDHGVVDTNAARVLARAFSGAPLTAAASQRLADGLVPPGRAWAHNQSILDLGATVCVARTPHCAACPLTSACAWAAAGCSDPDPAVMTAGTGRPQARFEGSDRQGRGRLLAALRTQELAPGELAERCGWPDDAVRARRVADALVAEGLAQWHEGHLRTPS